MSSTNKVPRSLFILSTPSQAFFLSRTPYLVEEGILILTVKTKKDAKKILKYLEKFNWKSIFIWYIPVDNSKLGYYKILKIRLKIIKLKFVNANIGKIYIGSYVNLYNLSIVAEFEENSQIYLLYDGLQMIFVASQRKNNLDYSVHYPFLMELLQFKRPSIKALTFISPFHLKISNRDSLYLISNSKEYNKKEYDMETIYFIGQPLSNIGIVSTNYYLSSLKILKEHFKDKNIIYLPHPREGVKMVASIQKFLDIKKTDEIFEEFFLNSHEFPHKIISFYSSALFNLIFLNSGADLIALEIPDAEIKNKIHREHLAPIYEHFKHIHKNNFSLLDLEYIAS